MTTETPLHTRSLFPSLKFIILKMNEISLMSGAHESIVGGAPPDNIMFRSIYSFLNEKQRNQNW